MTTNNSINANSTSPLPIVDGGTGVTTPVTSPTAAQFAGWDSNLNLSANNFLEGYATTPTAASTTTLTVASAYQQFFTGITTQTVVMPVTSTLALGQTWLLVNNSTGAITVQSSGGNIIVTMAANTQTIITCILTSGTTAASWSSDYSFSSGSIASITAVAHQTTVSITGNVATVGTVQNIDTTSSPTFAALTLTNPYIAGAGGLHSFQVFTSGTSATYTKPSNVTSILVEVVGGGGGSGGVTGGSSGAVSASGGGGGGGYARLFVANAASTYTYTVGAGGTAGTSGNNAGGNGGTTTFSAASLQATGGSGGQGDISHLVTANANTTAAAAGGVGSNGNINVNGSYSTPSAVLSGSVLQSNGGSSHLGGGAYGGIGGNYGGGAGGNFATTTSAAGFAGASGLIIVWEFA